MSENTNEEFDKLSFIDKCKKDPIIPASFILAFLAIVGAAIYFVLPYRTPAMKITLEEFKESYESTEMYNNLFINFGLDISPVTYIDTANVSTEGFAGYYPDDNFGELNMTEFESDRDYFQVTLNSDIITLMQGSSRKSDGKLTSLRFITKYGGDPTWMSYYYASVLEALYTDLDPTSAVNVIATILQEFDINTQGKYTVMGDYAFRLMYLPANGGNYFAFDVVPASSVKGDQISSTMAMEDMIVPSSSDAIEPAA